MKMLFAGIVSAAMLCGFSSAQDATSPTQPAPTTQAAVPTNGTRPNAAPRIAPGSVIPVQLTKGIDAKKAKTGDAVEAKVTQDMKTGSGEIIVPKDTKVVGHVTEAQARSKDQKESQVGIAFDHAVMKDGDDVALPMSIQAVIAPPNSNTNNNAGSESPSEPASSPSYGGSQSNSAGRTGGMPSGTQNQASNVPAANEPSPSQTSANARAPITGNTEGVVGIANLKLAMASNAAEGSVVSSEKNNVKLETGTMMLLKVNP
jgi:hypothetical protein